MLRKLFRPNPRKARRRLRRRLCHQERPRRVRGVKRRTKTLRLHMCQARLRKNNRKRTYKISQKIAWNHQRTVTEEIWITQSALNQTRKQCINKLLRRSSRRRNRSQVSLTRSRSRQLSYCHLRVTKTNLHPISSNKMNHQPKVKVKAKLRNRAFRQLLKILINTKRSSKSSTRLIWTKKKTRTNRVVKWATPRTPTTTG